MKHRQNHLQLTFPSLWRIIQRFATQIRKQGLLLFFSFIALLAETMFRLLEPWFLKFMFERIILTGFELEAIEIPALDRLNTTEILTVLAECRTSPNCDRDFSSLYYC